MPSTPSSRKKLAHFMLCQITNGSVSQFGWLLCCFSVGSEVNLRLLPLDPPPPELDGCPSVCVFKRNCTACFLLFISDLSGLVCPLDDVISSQELVSQLLTRMIDASSLLLQCFCATINQSFIYLVAAVLSALFKVWLKEPLGDFMKPCNVHLPYNNMLQEKAFTFY